MNKEMKKTAAPRLRFPEFREGWKEKALGDKDVSKITMGSSPQSASYNEKKLGLPLLQGNADIKNRLSFPRIFTSQITKECQVNDILLSVRAPVGTVAKSIHHACIGRGIAAIRASKNNSQEFLYQWLISFEPYWKNISQGGTFDAVNSDEIRKLSVYIPSPPEQHKIAACLTSLDEHISAESARLTALRAHKKGLMQQIFPAEGERVPKLRFGEFRGEWEEKRIEELAKRGSGHTPNKSEPSYYNGRVKWVSLADSKKLDNGYIYETQIEISEEGIKNSSAVLHPAGTVIVSRDAGVGKSAVLFSEMAVSQHFMVWRCDNSKISNWFLYYFLQVLKPKLESIATGSTIKTIGLPYFKELRITVPSIHEQQKIAACLTSLDELIAAQGEKIAALQAHKKGLMQGLFPNPNDTLS